MPSPTLTAPALVNPGTGALAQLVVISALAIRDTNTHDCTTDTPGLPTFLADLHTMPGARALYVANSLNQAVTISLEYSVDGITVATIGSTVSVASGTRQYIDASSIAQLAGPFPYLAVQAQCGTGPS